MKAASSIRTLLVGTLWSASTLLLLGGAPFARAAELRASDGSTDDFFGSFATQSGTIGAIAAAFDDVGANIDQGSVYIFRSLDTSTGTRTENLKLVASDGARGDWFGISVSLSGTSALVGAMFDDTATNTDQGSVYVFRGLDTGSGTRTEDLRLLASDGAANDNFGRSVSLAGNTGIVGAAGDDIGSNSNQGSAYVFRGIDSGTGVRNENVKLIASDGAANDEFGYSVSLSGNTGLVSARGNNTQGAAYVFRGLDSGTGVRTQDLKLIASDGAAFDTFGESVSLSGNTGLVGAFGDDIAGVQHGSAYLYRNLNTGSGTRTEDLKLVASASANSQFFGSAVSLSGNTAVIGDHAGDNYQGAAYLFTGLNTGTGTRIEDVRLTASIRAVNDEFGQSVSIQGDQFVIGSVRGDGKATDSGTAYTGNVSSFTTLDKGNVSQEISRLSFVSQTDWIVGQTTSGNHLTISAGDSADVTVSGKGVYIGQLSGANNNSLLVKGTVTTNNATIGASSGTTGNSLEITETGKVSATKVIVNSGGTLLFSGSNTSNDRLGDSTTVTLAGGSLNTGGLSEGTTDAVGLGALTLSATSVIDLSAGASVLHFSGSNAQTWAPNAVLNIYNWRGSFAGGGTDQLIFGSSTGTLTDTQLSELRFYSDAGGTFLGTGRFSMLNNGEVVPVPETVPALAAGLVVAYLVRRHARRSSSTRLVLIDASVRRMRRNFQNLVAGSRRRWWRQYDDEKEQAGSKIRSAEL